ncbi:MAG TPA: hypothetical protein VFY65_10185 [Longimicrobium sp.]|nr:hypothetical protein [Longimicrobium sp.]
MSEYQYYEFQAVDRPLTDDEMRQMRAVSSRARITSTRFVNDYSWGDFKGQPDRWMERWFDAFLYLANWGTRRLMLRLPASVLDVETARRYCPGENVTAWDHGDFVILSFTADDEESRDWVEEDEDDLGSLGAMLPLREELAAGDHRVLYLGWLLLIQSLEWDDEDPPLEPPVPPGLGTLTGALQAFRDFLRIDPDLVHVAAERSPALAAPHGDAEVRRWIAALADDEKVELLARVAAGREREVRMQLVRGVHAARPAADAADGEPRTAQALLDAAEERAEARARAEAEAAAREKARRAAAAAAARQRHLDLLAGRDEELWHNVDALAASKRPASYDEAVALLKDLRDLAARDGRDEEFRARFATLRQQHARKPSFIDRLRKVAG